MIRIGNKNLKNLLNMKKIILITILLITKISNAQESQTKLLILNKDTVGLMRTTIDPNHQSLGISEGRNPYMFINSVELNKPISKKEKKFLINKYGTFDNVQYEFKYTSDYLKQSTDLKERSINIHRATRIIGNYILPAFGAFVALNGSPQLGVAIGAAGFLTAEIGFHISLTLDSKSNQLISKASNKLKSLE
jgi:hypothetical protein